MQGTGFKPCKASLIWDICHLKKISAYSLSLKRYLWKCRLTNLGQQSALVGPLSTPFFFRLPWQIKCQCTALVPTATLCLPSRSCLGHDFNILPLKKNNKKSHKAISRSVDAKQILAWKLLFAGTPKPSQFHLSTWFQCNHWHLSSPLFPSRSITNSSAPF